MVLDKSLYIVTPLKPATIHEFNQNVIMTLNHWWGFNTRNAHMVDIVH